MKPDEQIGSGNGKFSALSVTDVDIRGLRLAAKSWRQVLPATYLFLVAGGLPAFLLAIISFVLFSGWEDSARLPTDNSTAVTIGLVFLLALVTLMYAAVATHLAALALVSSPRSSWRSLRFVALRIHHLLPQAAVATGIAVLIAALLGLRSGDTPLLDVAILVGAGAIMAVTMLVEGLSVTAIILEGRLGLAALGRALVLARKGLIHNLDVALRLVVLLACFLIGAWFLTAVTVVGRAVALAIVVALPVVAGGVWVSLYVDIRARHDELTAAMLSQQLGTSR